MHANTAHMMAMANTFWPLAYTFGKSYDLSLHPAFLSSAYRGLPALPTSPYGSPTNVQISAPVHSNKSDKFSIDAILNRDKRQETEETSGADDIKKFSPNFSENDKIHETSISRRHQRLLEASHPYLSHATHYTDLRHPTQQQQQQTTTMSTPYRQLTDSPPRPGITGTYGV